MVRRPGRVAAAGTVLFAVVAVLAVWQWYGGTSARDGFPSVAVLPFQNFGGDSALDSYSNGVAEDLTTAMSRFPDITVISRNSSFGKQGYRRPSRVRTPDVDYIIEGSVQKIGQRAAHQRATD